METAENNTSSSSLPDTSASSRTHRRSSVASGTVDHAASADDDERTLDLGEGALDYVGYGDDGTENLARPEKSPIMSPAHPERSVDLDGPRAFGHVEDGNGTCAEATSKSRKPFHKWMKTLQRRAARRHRMLSSHGDKFLSADGSPWISAYRRQSSSNSSLGFVTAAKTASISLASASLYTRSRRTTLLSSRGHSRTDRSSRASISGVRLSEDSIGAERSVSLDPAVTERSLQRRRILEELIGTEESYIGDVRFLMNVYITILASLPTLPAGLRSSINRNLTDVVELHEEMLGELHRVVPYSEYTQVEIPVKPTSPGHRGHHRWRSLGSVPEDKGSIAWLQSVPGMTTEPQVAAEVARVFARKMNRFFIYEEYGAKYELMIKDVASAHRTMPRWESYQKGLEALAASLGSANSQADHAKKSLTIGDLLVKPIQRVCKYPLLFAELLKYTPVVDCPHSHMEIENTLIRLREATAEINRATDDARIKAVLEKTWILQDRLTFANQMLDAASKNRIRSFGHVQLCGTLHVCWQAKEGITGQYMIALLYRECMCLATASRADQIYTIQACIALNNIKVEEVDNGRGLQCHTAPYSWKLVFIFDHQLYEMILTACTPREQDEWRSRLTSRPLLDNQDQSRPALFSTLALNIKSLGTVFGKPGTIARRISIHRATTVGPKSPMCQVILKNTSVIKDAPTPSTSAQINRSQSLLTTNGRIPVLAPSRGERARLEALLSDVWSRDILPFPGITSRTRSENVRAGASSVIRKLSVASIASTFTKRSITVASLKTSVAGDEEGTRNSIHGRRRDRNHSAASRAISRSTEDVGKSFLSAITDVSDRRTASRSTTATSEVTKMTVAVESDWGVDVLRTVQRLGKIKVTTAKSALTKTANEHRSCSCSGASSVYSLTFAAIGSTRPGTPQVARPTSSQRSFSQPGRPESRSDSLALTHVASSGTGGSSGKENEYSQQDLSKDIGRQKQKSTSASSSIISTSQQQKIPNRRWATRVGVRHRDVVVQGIRNIFR